MGYSLHTVSTLTVYKDVVTNSEIDFTKSPPDGMDYTIGVHILQKDIIDQLRATDSLRYSELQPRDIESSHFKYHLNQLIIDGIVEQRSRGVYGLTQKGQAFTDRLSEHRIHPHAMPKSITYTLLEDEQSYYLYKKTKEPYRDLLNMIGGKMHVGETPAEASKREVYEKTGLNIVNQQLKGVATIQIYSNDELLSHAVSHIFSGELHQPNEQLISISKQSIRTIEDLAPDLLTIIEHIEGSQVPFITDISLHL